MSNSITCPACGHPEAVPDGGSTMLASIAVFVCDPCGFRSVFGRAMPRIVVEPYTDDRGIRWLRRRVQDPITKADIFVFDLDPQHAAREAVNILSLTVGS